MKKINCSLYSSCINSRHFAKEYIERFVTDEGIDICINDLQSLKAKWSIFFEEEGFSKRTLTKDEHLQKEYVPIDVIEAGIMICVNDSQL